MSQDAINSLREAIRVSPENVPLRMALADMLLGSGRAEEAEKEYRAALATAADDPRLKLGLANAFFQQGKNSHAMVIVEDLVKQRSVAGNVYLLHARLLERAGDTDGAGRQYRKAIDAAPALVDDELARRLDVQPSSKFSDDEVIDGKVRVSDGPGSGTDIDRAIERPKMSFADVGGLEGLKDEIRMKIIYTSPRQH